MENSRTTEEFKTTEHGPQEGRSTVQLVKDIATDSASLVRKEIELAKQEIAEGLKAKATGAAALAAAGVFGLLFLLFFAVFGAVLLDIKLQKWQAWGIVALVFLVMAGGAALFGLRRMKSAPLAPEETKRTVKEDVEWAKAQLKR